MHSQSTSLVWEKWHEIFGIHIHTSTSQPPYFWSFHESVDPSILSVATLANIFTQFSMINKSVDIGDIFLQITICKVSRRLLHAHHLQGFAETNKLESQFVNTRCISSTSSLGFVVLSLVLFPWLKYSHIHVS